ncbi:MAG: hypothetical protein J6Z17_00480 [Treponema sp.]|nr:hypothetical protein [Treponema sp.]
MSVQLKTGLKVLISLILTALCMLFIFTGGFTLIEVKFYKPRVLAAKQNLLSETEAAFTAFSDSYKNKFSNYLAEKSLLTFFDRDVTAEDALARDGATQELFSANPGLEGIRLIDADGIHVHYSSYASDLLRDEEDFLSYRNYGTFKEFPVQKLKFPSKPESPCTLCFDGELNRLIFLNSVFNEFGVLRGVFLFYVSGDDFVRYLTQNDVLPLNTRGIVIEPDGFVFGVPLNAKTLFVESIMKKWERGLYGTEPLSYSDEKTLFLVSHKGSVTLGIICDESEFSLSDAEKILLVIGTIITLFLIFFIVFNIRQEDSVIINARIKKFQFTLVREYIERRDTADWASLAKEIARRKYDVSEEIKKSLGVLGKKHNEEIDALIDKSWAEVLGALAGAASVSLSHYEAKQDETSEKSAELEKLEEPAELEELSDADDTQEPAELEELSDADDTQEPAELEELGDADDTQEPAELEELGDADDSQEPAELEELGDADDTQEPAELEELGDADDTQEPAELEELGDADSPAQKAEELAELDEFVTKDEPDKFEEITLEEFLASENIVKKVAENSEEIKQNAENSFTILPMAFTDLDKTE